MNQAGVALTGLALVVASPENPFSFNPNTQAEEIKKSAPLIEILDNRYEFKILAEGLNWPEELVISPKDDKLFFVQKSRTDSSEGVYELVSSGVEYRFPGAGDPWGQRHQTRIAVNDKNELFVYSMTYIDENLKIWDTKTGKEVLDIEGPYKEDKGDYQKVNHIAMNPKDGRLYVMRWIGGSIDVLDRERKRVIPWIKKGPSMCWFCFDSNGNLYAPSFNKGLVKFSLDKKEEKVKEPILVGVLNDTKSDPKTYWDPCGSRIISDKASFINGSFYEGFEKDDPRVKDLSIMVCTSIECLEGKTVKSYEVFYSLDSEKNEARPILRVNDNRFTSRGFCLDRHGNLYFSTCLWSGGDNKYPGKIVRVSRK